MTIKQTSNSFFMEEDGDSIAEIVFNTSYPGRFIIEHTEVDEEYQGRQIGKQLVHHAVDYAKKQNLELVVRCSYAKKVLDEER